MPELKNILKPKKIDAGLFKPQLFNLTGAEDKRKLKKLLGKNKAITISDDFTEQLRELFAINNPKAAFSPDFEKLFQANLKNSGQKIPFFEQGRWVYFPWLKSLSHILPENDFFKVRTARNKLLITQAEQEKFYNATVGIAGLSIGSSVAAALVLQGGAKNLRLADFDKLALSNTNRVRAGVHNLGLMKVLISAAQIYEINPYANIKIFPEGITQKNLKNFVNGLDVLVDEIDSLSTKLLLRIEAKKNKIPVVMGADNADSAVVDIERHDKNKKTLFFHNRLGKVSHSQLLSLSKMETGKTIARLIGLENHTERMLDSLGAMGKSIVSWPQLGGTAMLNGSAVAYCVRKILCGQSLKDNRGIVSLDEIFQQDYFSKKQKDIRKKTVENFKKIFGI
jgi:hypothetical protein